MHGVRRALGRVDVSQEVLDAVIRRAVSDAHFCQKLRDPKQFDAALEGLDLTQEEKARLRHIMLEKAGTALPFAERLRERLAK